VAGVDSILNGARDLVELGFTLGPQGNYYQAPTGEPYVTVVSGGVKLEGECFPCLCSTPELAVKLWLEAMGEYAAPDKGKTLYWRAPPEIDEIYMMPVGGDGSSSHDPDTRRALTRKAYVVYSRVLVSGKPRIQPAWLPAPNHAA
jgi:hypothetical protein